MTPVETLRAAAADMRVKAEAVGAAERAEWSDWLICGPGSNEAHQRELRHIASWHPAVALAVADVLHYAADGIDRTWQDVPEVSLPEPYLTALAVARAYLGES